MIIPLAIAFSLSLTFVGQEIDGLQVARWDPMSWVASGNFHHADVDNDGLADILLSDRVMLQRAGEFPPALVVRLPKPADRVRYAVVDGALWVRFPGGFEIYRLEGMQWKRLIAQSMNWPDLPVGAQLGGVAQVGHPVNLWLDYSHDLDADGMAELVIPDHGGLAVFQLRDNRLERAGLIQVFPEPKAMLPRGEQLWPEEARRLRLPATRQAFNIFIDADTLLSTERIPVLDGRSVFAVSRFSLALDSKTFSATLLSESRTQAVPSFLQPCMLNSDDVIDLAGTVLHEGRSDLTPERIYDTHLSTDMGKTLQVFRTKSFHPSASFVDFDADGDLDLVLEVVELFQGGVRDFFTRAISSRRLRHTVIVHLQDASGTYSKSPDVRHQVTIRLDAPPLRNSVMFERYQQGLLLSLGGDFNGDTRPDLAVQTGPAEISIYLNQGSSFSSSADHVLEVGKISRFVVVDVDGDGISDIVCYPEGAAEQDVNSSPRIYFTREKASS